MQRRTRIKICGVMRPQDAALAAGLGADAIGIIFHPPAPRNCSPDAAAGIVSILPPFVTLVGVFADSEPQEILDIISPLGIGTVQLNGKECAEDISELEGLRVIKSVRVTRGELTAELAKWKELLASPAMRHVVGLVLEPGGTKQPGGTGVANDWEEVKHAQAAGLFKDLPPVIAAGGLRPETIAGVVEQIRPYAVDVSSGVESQLGIKSEQMMKDFITSVRKAEIT